MIRGIKGYIHRDDTFIVPIEDAVVHTNDLWIIEDVPSMKKNISNPYQATARGVIVDKIQLFVDGEVIDEWEK